MKFPILIQVIQIRQPLGNFWAASIPARLLRECVVLDPTRIESVDKASFLYKLIGNQREASIPRTKEIARYIDSVEAAFPNSIIIGANHIDTGPLSDNDPNRWKLIKNNEHYYLEIPSLNKAATIIDGQHRLLGFDHAKDIRKDMELLCSVYFDLPLAYQAYLFATININQRKVDKSLAYEQFGYNLDDEEPHAWAPDKLAVYLTRKLNLDPSSPFCGHIKLAPLNADLVLNEEDYSWQISTACIVEGILSLISSRPAADRDALHTVNVKDRNRKNLPSDSSPLRSAFQQCQDDVILATLKNFFSIAKNKLWNIANERSYINKTIGISALFDVLRHVLLKYDAPKIEERLKHTLETAATIDFSNSFFQASGKGRVRVKNVILRAAKEIAGADLPKTDASEYAIYAQTTNAYK